MHVERRRAWIAIAACLALVITGAPAASAQSSGFQPGPDAVLDNTYAGFVDQPANGGTVPGSGTFAVSGWFVDSTAQGWAGADNVQVWLGTMDGGGTMLAQAQFAQPRPDVAAALGNPFDTNSGYFATVQGSSVPGGSQTLSVYAHTPGKGWWLEQVTVNGGGAAASAPAPGPAPAGPSAGGPPTLTITAPSEGQNVNAAGGVSYTITGVAQDPVSGGSGIDSVDVWIFGEKNASGATELGTVTPDSSGNWSLQFKPTKFPSTHTNIYVYAHSKTTGQTTEVARGFNITG